jgi:hypothetical protein
MNQIQQQHSTEIKARFPTIEDQGYSNKTKQTLNTDAAPGDYDRAI